MIATLFSHSKAHLNSLTLSDLDHIGHNNHHDRPCPPIESEKAHDLWMDKKIRTDEYRAVFNGEAMLISLHGKKDQIIASECVTWLKGGKAFEPIRCFVGLKKPWRVESRIARRANNRNGFMYFETQAEAIKANASGDFQARVNEAYRVRRGEVRWLDYMDGNVHTLVAGADYDCSKASIRDRAQRAASRIGVILEIIDVDDGSITFQSLGAR